MTDATPRENDHEPAGAGAPDAPDGGAPADEVAAALVERFAGAVAVEHHGQPVVYVPADVFAEVAIFLRDTQQFSMLVDVTAVDHLLDGVRHRPDGVDGLERFEVVANYLSHARNRRVRVICQVPAHAPAVPSLVPVFPGADFPEREAYDLFGVVFEGHPDLTRILMPDDWDGHPLRKDFPAARVPVTFKGDPSPR